MPLSIKDPAAHEQARELARETGETITTAVAVAIRERLERLRRQRRRASAEELLEIGRRCAAELQAAPPDHAELLYDERGLPR